MSRNYILQLEEAVFTDNTHGFIFTDIREYFQDAPDLTGTTLEIGGEKFLYAGDVAFTRDGTAPGSDPEELAAFADTALVLKANKYPVSGAPYTLSVYLYTDEDEPSWAEKVGLPEMNVVHEHKETAKNDIEEIIQAIYAKLEMTEEDVLLNGNIDNYPGYSPMDRLVIAVATFFESDATTVLAAGYPNQLKKIAAIIRGDFNSDSESPGKTVGPGSGNIDEVG